jgi:hypothetical protein
MTIEVVPRSPEGTAGWKPGKGNREAKPATLVPVGATRGIRVDVVKRPAWSPRPSGSWLLFLLFFANPLGAMWRGFRWWVVAGAVLLLGAMVCRWLRLARLSYRGEGHVVIWPGGVTVGGLDVPWSQIEEVVRFHVGRREDATSFLGIRVRDFVEVRGLSPFWAGLANLSRRHLVVLASASELANADALAKALDHLVAHPEARALLATDAGVRLVATGQTP